MIYKLANTVHTEKITTRYSTLLKSQNHPSTIIKQIPLMVSRRISYISCNKEYFNKAALGYNNTFIFNSRQHPHQKGIIIENLHVSIHHIVSTWKPTSLEYFYIALTSTSHNIINTTSYSIETISRLAKVAC